MCVHVEKIKNLSKNTDLLYRTFYMMEKFADRNHNTEYTQFVVFEPFSWLDGIKIVGLGFNPEKHTAGFLASDGSYYELTKPSCPTILVQLANTLWDSNCPVGDILDCQEEIKDETAPGEKLSYVAGVVDEQKSADTRSELISQCKQLLGDKEHHEFSRNITLNDIQNKALIILSGISSRMENGYEKLTFNIHNDGGEIAVSQLSDDFANQLHDMLNLEIELNSPDEPVKENTEEESKEESSDA